MTHPINTPKLCWAASYTNIGKNKKFFYTDNMSDLFNTWRNFKLTVLVNNHTICERRRNMSFDRVFLQKK